jgi:BlaI family transcriptional regulator, penicillinase repressor
MSISPNGKKAPPDDSKPLPTDAEFDILAVLWKIGPATVREVHEAMAKGSAYTTTLKQMQVMIEKGLLTRTERFRNHIYEAGIPKEQTQIRIAGNLLARTFDGSAKNLVMGALAAKPASPGELSEIRQLLDRIEKGKSPL